MDADQFQNLLTLLTIATIGITLFLAMGLSYMTSSNDYLSAKIFSGLIIFVVIWVIALIIWAILKYSGLGELLLLLVS